MATNVKFDLSEFTPWQKKVLKRYRFLIYRSLAESMEQIREAAPSNIIPNTVGKRMSPYSMWLKQPPSESKLTERTGRTIKMIQDDGRWMAGSKDLQSTAISQLRVRTARFRNMGLDGIIKADAGYGTASESYVATLKVGVKDDNPFIGKGFVGSRKKETKRSLVMRFMHEWGRAGVRGRRRPFFEPAVQDQTFNVHAIIRQRIETIGHWS